MLRRFAKKILEKTDKSPHVNREDAFYTDNFITWLRFANAGMLHGGNVAALYRHVLPNLPSAAPMVEVGTFCGLSTNVITHFKRELGLSNPLITCDPWQGEGGGGMIGHLPYKDYRDFVKDTYIRNVRFFSADDLPYTLEMFSDDFFEAWRKAEELTDVLDRPVKLGGPISFAYIDGNHEYEYAKRDFENADAYLESGGFILFDDSADKRFGVRDVMRDVEETGRYELVLQNPNHLFRKR